MFSLLELVIVLLILGMAAGLTGQRIYFSMKQRALIQDYKRFSQQLFLCRNLALSMQSDWKFTARKTHKGWVIQSACLEQKKKLPPLHLRVCLIEEQESPCQKVTFHCFATGKVSPKRQLQFSLPSGSKRLEWSLEKNLQLKEGFPSETQ